MKSLKKKKLNYNSQLKSMTPTLDLHPSLPRRTLQISGTSDRLYRYGPPGAVGWTLTLTMTYFSGELGCQEKKKVLKLYIYKKEFENKRAEDRIGPDGWRWLVLIIVKRLQTKDSRCKESPKKGNYGSKRGSEVREMPLLRDHCLSPKKTRTHVNI